MEARNLHAQAGQLLPCSTRDPQGSGDVAAVRRANENLGALAAHSVLNVSIVTQLTEIEILP
jgi:hypothetical protein